MESDICYRERLFNEISYSHYLTEELADATGSELDNIGDEIGIFRHRSVFGEKGFEPKKKKKRS